MYFPETYHPRKIAELDATDPYTLRFVNKTPVTCHEALREIVPAVANLKKSNYFFDNYSEFVCTRGPT